MFSETSSFLKASTATILKNKYLYLYYITVIEGFVEFFIFI